MPTRLVRDDVLGMNSLLAQSLGFGPIGDVYYLAGATGNTYARITGAPRQLVPDEFLYTTGPYGPYNATTTYQNDVICVAPDSHTWKGDSDVTAASLTWAKSNTHMVGMAPFSKGGGMRSRFGHGSNACASFFTVSGHNNLFKNLYWMHGSSTGGASDLQVGKLTGARNVFDGCHFAGPNDPTQSATAGYNTIEEDGTQNYFKDCLWGGMNAIHRNAANCLLKIGGGQGTVYENCVFWSRTNVNTSAYFINIDTAVTEGSWVGIFLNCQFINVTPLDGSYEMAVAIASTPALSNENYLYFDNRCSFAGATTLIAAANERQIVWGGSGATPDSAALNDNINLGLARRYNNS